MKVPQKGLCAPTFFHNKKKTLKISILIIHDFPGRMAENEDTLKAGRPLCKLLKQHKDVGDTGLRDIQEVELKGSGDHQHKTD